ncbi:MAG: arginine--tRNA ligase, partial [Deltaproteobacteria bacterium]|nr:arginine--tRNA ligase [Deltaproteobacteria bacterium]
EEIIDKGQAFGDSNIGEGKKVQIEFVSANPTGPLHIGHGRGAAVGDTLARIMSSAGFDVTREYYINDVGNQMNTLGRSLKYRYLELLGGTEPFPDDHYKGEYMKDIAKDFITKFGDKYKDSKDEELTEVFTSFASDSILSGIKKDLKDFGITFDQWFSEEKLHREKLVEKTMDELRASGYVYDEDGATWFGSESLGDDKNRVLRKQDGSLTYFAADIAYHKNKIERGFDKIIDVWGADHHGYKGRVDALMKALGQEPEKLEIIFIQLVSLLRDGVPVAMSTRAGEFITLNEVLKEVGSDACRFSFLMRKSDAQLEFDLEVAKKQAPENPVYYVQYCFARIRSIIDFAKESGIEVDKKNTKELIKKLDAPDELALIKYLASFEEMIEKSSIEMAPHRVTFYLQDLAGQFHSYYNKNRIVGEDKKLSEARLLLASVVAGVVKKGLSLLGVSAPEKM